MKYVHNYRYLIQTCTIWCTYIAIIVSETIGTILKNYLERSNYVFVRRISL